MQINSTDFHRELIFHALVLITKLIIYGEGALVFKHSLCATAVLTVILCSQCLQEVTALLDLERFFLLNLQAEKEIARTGKKEPVSADDTKGVYSTN